MDNPALGNLTGIGATLEGFNNPVVYEMLFERIWHGDKMDLQSWFKTNAWARAGCRDKNVEQAWDLFRGKILVDDVNPIGTHNVIFAAKTPALHGTGNWEVAYSNSDLFRAWAHLLAATPAAVKSPAYRRDLVDITRQALGNLGVLLRDKMATAYDQKDASAFEKASRDFMTLGLEIDNFLGTNTEYMLGKWIEDAKSWAVDEHEKGYFERNARTLITTWYSRDSELTDYAGRQWNGLMRDYYIPRWQILIDSTLTELRTGNTVERGALEKQWRDCDWAFARKIDGHYATETLWRCCGEKPRVV